MESPKSDIWVSLPLPSFPHCLPILPFFTQPFGLPSPLSPPFLSPSSFPLSRHLPPPQRLSSFLSHLFSPLPFCSPSSVCVYLSLGLQPPPHLLSDPTSQVNIKVASGRPRTSLLRAQDTWGGIGLCQVTGRSGGP